MASIGQWNTLEIVDRIDAGLLLDAGDCNILMPNRYIYEGCEIGETADVFVYPDTTDRLIATTERPYAVVGEFASLRCVDLNPTGAFVELGLLKQLLVPYAMQSHELEVGKDYIVRVYLDEKTQRLVGTTKLNKYLNDETTEYVEDQEVDLLIAARTDLGYKAIINHTNWGLLYEDQVFGDLKVGHKVTGYVYMTRPDGKIDLSLHLPAEKKVEALTTQIINELDENGGTLPLSDKSPPEAIYEAFSVSKKTFKRALGSLYKDKLIMIESDKITKL